MSRQMQLLIKATRPADVMRFKTTEENNLFTQNKAMIFEEIDRSNRV
jgi:hypothetical protein